MNKHRKLEDCKKEIRSILMNFPRGCSLNVFSGVYIDMIRERLPSKEFGYRTDVDFLRSLPDIVKISTSGRDQYHLEGIADHNTKHVQNMVSRENSVNSVTSPRRPLPQPPKTAYDPPPRYRTRFEPCKEYEPSQTRENTSKPNISLRQDKSASREYKSPKEEMVALVRSFKDGIDLSEILFEYKRKYDKSFPLDMYEFPTLEEFIKSDTTLNVVEINDGFRVVCQPLGSNSGKGSAKNSNFARRKERRNCAEDLRVRSRSPSFSSSGSRSPNESGCELKRIPEFMKESLRKVAKKYPDGIWASTFLSHYEEVNFDELDIHDLGYKTLSEFIDEVPDIFTRDNVVGGAHDDYLINVSEEFESNIYDSILRLEFIKPPPKIDHVIQNIRRILETFPGGIKLLEFLKVYKAHYRDDFSSHDFGFSDLEAFLSSISDRVPLLFEYDNRGIKTILLDINESSLDSCESFETCEYEIIPYDAVPVDFQFKKLSLSDDFHRKEYFPVYISFLKNPDYLFLHMADDNIKKYEEMSDEINEFYSEGSSDLYIMKNADIKPELACVAMWPGDQQWHRAQILWIPSERTVEVIFVDYGCTEIISKAFIRYLRKDFAELPCQAVKCRLAFLKPAQGAETWDPNMRNHLKSFIDIVLMSKIEEEKSDGVYSILLCNTNGDQDTYIHEALCNEGFAEYDETQTDCHSLSPQQALKALEALQPFATLAPSFVRNQHYIRLKREISMYLPTGVVFRHRDTPVSSSKHEDPTAIIAAATTMLPPRICNSGENRNMDQQPSKTQTHAERGDSTENASFDVLREKERSQKQGIPSNFRSSAEDKRMQTDKYCNNSEFRTEVDGEMCQKFRQKLRVTEKRFVKRITLDDCSKIHIIAVQSKPFVSSGDISQFMWENKAVDYLSRRLQLKNASIPSLNLSEDGNEELFRQLEMFDVKGAVKTAESKPSILLYPLEQVIKVLNMFGHPSTSIRSRITEEIAYFDLNDPVWKEYPAKNAESNEEAEDFEKIVVDEGFEKLCLYDLLPIKEKIKCKISKLINDTTETRDKKSDEEILKLEQMLQKVMQRIKEIKAICNFK